ncbi:MAG: DUF1080 domain-containing protein [Planctomycetales bacterium]|nr:DUF1080 domain-containing protein [Planctomycetales bacterium]
MLRFIVLVLAFLAPLSVAVSYAEAQNEGRELFNGKDLSGWRGNTELWSVEDGCITGRTSAEKPLTFNTFLIWEGKVGDFELELDYKMVGGNSGIQYRSKVLDDEKFVVGGYQADIDATLRYAGINYEEKGRGILAQRGQRVTIKGEKNSEAEEFGDGAELGKVIRKEEWNHYRVVAQGNKLSHYINDTLMSEVIDNQADKAASEGVLALQIHVGPPMVVQFKNIRLKTIK